MAIATTQSVGTPFAKLVELFDTLIGAFGSDPGLSRRQARNFETKLPATKGDGSPLFEEILYFVVMPGTTAKKGDNDSGYTVFEPGDIVRFAVSGYKWGQVIGERKLLPARAGFGAGVACSGDVYTITLAGWSAETKNPPAAEAAGFTVVEKRIVLKSQDDKDKYVLHQSRAGGNTNPGRDFTISIRRPVDDEKVWEQKADELYLTKPWESNTADGSAPAAAGTEDIPLEPF